MRDAIRKIVNNTMGMLAGMQLAVPVDYTHVTDVSYDPVSGSTTETTTAYDAITAVLTSFTADERTEDVVVITDRKALIAYTALPVVPSTNDYFVTDDGARWEVKKVLGYPGEPVHKLHVRRA